MENLYVIIPRAGCEVTGAILRWTVWLSILNADFDNPQGALKGIIAAAYSLGAILSLPLVPIVNERLGRRWSIFLGSSIMMVGALIQGFSQHGRR